MEAVVVVLLLAFFLLILLKRKKNVLLPPSPRALPILGHLHLLKGIPYQALTDLARIHGPYMFLKLGSKPTLVVSSSNAAEQVLKVHDVTFSSKRKGLISETFGFEGSGLVWARYGESWRQARKLCVLELLTSKKVESFRPVRAAEMTNFIDSLLDLSSKGQLVIDMTLKISEFTFNVMCRLVINKSYSKADNEGAKQAIEFRNVIVEAFKVAGRVHIGDFIPWLNWLDFSLPLARKLHRKMDEFLQRQIDEHRANYRPDHLRDFLDILLSVDDTQIDHKKLKAIILDMIVGGTETSALTVEWALSELIQNPDIMDKARQEIQLVVGKERMVRETDLPKLEYLHAIMKETFRLHPPLPLVSRESIEACKVDEFMIPAQTQLFVNMYAIGRDSSSWKDPLKFDPARFLGNNNIKNYGGQDFEFIPFGSGRRSCPGMLLATTFVQFLLANLIHGFRWSTESHEKLDMNEGMGMTLVRASRLRLVVCADLKPHAYRHNF